VRFRGFVCCGGSVSFGGGDFGEGGLGVGFAEGEGVGDGVFVREQVGVSVTLAVAVAIFDGVVVVVFAIGVRLVRGKVQDCHEVDRGLVEREEPDGECLPDGYVEEVCALVEDGGLNLEVDFGAEDLVCKGG